MFITSYSHPKEQHITKKNCRNSLRGSGNGGNKGAGFPSTPPKKGALFEGRKETVLQAQETKMAVETCNLSNQVLMWTGGYIVITVHSPIRLK